MAAEHVSPRDRRAAVRLALKTDLALGGDTTAPHIVASFHPDEENDPPAIVTLRVGPGGLGRQGWNGAIEDLFTIDVFVSEKADGDPPTTADRITKTINEALTQAKLKTALEALSTPVLDAEASARRTVEWQDVDEPGPQGGWHKSADVAVSFVKVTT